MLVQTRKDSIRLVSSSAATLDVVLGFEEGTFRSRTLTKISSATTTTISAAPDQQKIVNYIAVRNSHASTANTVTIQFFDGTNAYEIFKIVLAAGQEFSYQDGEWESPSSGGGGGGSVAWGDITGSLAAQTDLNSALSGKQDTLVSGTTIKTVNGNTLLGSGNLVVTGAESFETVSKNLQGQDATLNYSGGNLSTIVYASGITKTFNYTGSDLTSVVLSGTTPGGIDLTKTLTYSGGDLVDVTYS